jgi:hypothetical protein
MFIARERARRGESGAAIPVMRSAADELFQTGQLPTAFAATAVLVETLLGRGAEGDAQEAQSSIERLANVRNYAGAAVCDIWLLRLRAQLARASGDDDAYRALVSRYLSTARSLGFEGHIAMAEAM